ncbi:MAG: tRNA pseudouridine(55) synthase TruB [Thermoguttaceae bacterium]|nr:tRNA pseudouridine(55) synthase TruB [Thermoguttaceae bacterium]MDW8078771.1 tRNA pseudouridine(55) synthase TruB [Thermoguttaceae bacterium]
MDGFLLVDKPRGWTSRQVVDCAAEVLKTRRVGHAGTLDPIATGLVVVCVGKATRLTQFLHQGAKEYLALFQLGVTSPTDDADGPLSPVGAPGEPSQAEVETVLRSFIGRIMQRPPAYSAIKLGGKRAYDLARAGKEIELQPRPVEIHALELVRYQYPWLEIAVRCGPGTYIRALGRDIAERLGTGAVMHGLVRLRLGPFRLEGAVRPDKLTRETAPQLLHPMDSAVADLPRVVLERPAAIALLHGQQVYCGAQYSHIPVGSHVAVYDIAQNLLGVSLVTSLGSIRPVVNLRSASAL